MSLFSKIAKGLKSVVSAPFKLGKKLVGGVLEVPKSLISGVGSVGKTFAETLGPTIQQLLPVAASVLPMAAGLPPLGALGQLAGGLLGGAGPAQQVAPPAGDPHQLLMQLAQRFYGGTMSPGTAAHISNPLQPAMPWVGY